MFCPECQAEYRPGFTHCASCDVDLVATLEDARRAVYQAQHAASRDQDQLLWRGKDLGLYLQILTHLPIFGIPYLGRPAIPPVPGEPESAWLGSSSIEFDIWVAEQSFPMASWVLRTCEKSRQERLEDAELVKQGKTPARVAPPWKPEDEDESLLDRTFACPLCSANFATHIEQCPNCGIPVCSRRQADQTDVDSLSSLPHPDFTKALRAALLAAGIPFSNSQIRSGNIVPSLAGVRDDITVLSSDFERAGQIMANILRRWEFSPGLSVPAHRNNPLDSYWPVRADDNRWEAEDLTANIWSGTSLFDLSGVTRALHTHEIPYLVDARDFTTATVLVHPEDEEFSRELIRQITEGVSFE
jgi:hypothetical protein